MPKRKRKSKKLKSDTSPPQKKYELKLFCPDCTEEVNYTNYEKVTSNLYYGYLNCSNCKKDWPIPFVIEPELGSPIPWDLEGLWEINRLDLLESEDLGIKFPLPKGRLKTFKRQENKYKRLLKKKEVVQEEIDDFVSEHFRDLIRKYHPF